LSDPIKMKDPFDMFPPAGGWSFKEVVAALGAIASSLKAEAGRGYRRDSMFRLHAQWVERVRDEIRSIAATCSEGRAES